MLIGTSVYKQPNIIPKQHADNWQAGTSTPHPDTNNAGSTKIRQLDYFRAAVRPRGDLRGGECRLTGQANYRLIYEGNLAA